MPHSLKKRFQLGYLLAVWIGNSTSVSSLELWKIIKKMYVFEEHFLDKNF